MLIIAGLRSSTTFSADLPTCIATFETLRVAALKIYAGRVQLLRNSEADWLSSFSDLVEPPVDISIPFGPLRRAVALYKRPVIDVGHAGRIL
ncbi:hypothetical protein BDN67DRAFT_1003497, partial [Paxillus ammoniavirescens]